MTEKSKKKILFDSMLMCHGVPLRAFKPKKQEKCWLCGLSDPDPDTTITVECETPGGKHCKPYEVKVHFSCYMDMDA